MPDVSVIIPTYNRLDLLKTAIDSCFKGVGGIDVEVIVVDDGSTDGTREWLQEQHLPRIRPVFQTHKGAQHARNAGMDAAEGDAIKFLDDDDRLASGALREELKTLRRSEADVTYGDLQVYQESRGTFVFRQKETENIITGIFDGAIWTHPHVFLYEKSTLYDVSWDTDLSYEQDKDFAVRVAARKPKAVYLDRVVGIFNDHDGDRISNIKSKASVVERCLRRICLIERGLREMERRGFAESHEKEAAARGMWRSAYMLAIHDFQTFREVWKRIETVFPGFRPSRSNALLSACDRIVGPSKTERLMYPIRKIKQTLTSS